MSYQHQTKNTISNNQISVGEETHEGDYSRMPNELLEYLYQSDLTPIEFKIVIFLARQLYGWNTPFKKLQVKEIAAATKIARNKIHVALKKLEEKGLILKHPGEKFQTYYYSFSPNFFRQVIPISTPKEKSEWSQPRTATSPKLALLSSPDVGLQNTPETATVAETQASKDSIKDNIKDILRENVDKSTFKSAEIKSKKADWIHAEEINIDERKAFLRNQLREIEQKEVPEWSDDHVVDNEMDKIWEIMGVKDGSIKDESDFLCRLGEMMG